MRGLNQQIEEAKGAVPILERGVPEAGIDDLQATRQGDAYTAGDCRQRFLGVAAVGHVEQRQLRQTGEDRLDLEVLVDLAEFGDVFLQALGDRQLEQMVAA